MPRRDRSPSPGPRKKKGRGRKKLSKAARKAAKLAKKLRKQRIAEQKELNVHIRRAKNKATPGARRRCPRAWVNGFFGPSWPIWLILALLAAILPILLAILSPRCPNIARKWSIETELEANIGQHDLQDA